MIPPQTNLRISSLIARVFLRSGDGASRPSTHHDLAFINQASTHFLVAVVAPAQTLDHFEIRYGSFQRHIGERHLIISERSHAAASALKSDLHLPKQLGADLELGSLSPPKGFSEPLGTPRRSSFIELLQKELLFVLKSYRHGPTYTALRHLPTPSPAYPGAASHPLISLRTKWPEPLRSFSTTAR
jgi:hypothetical protein